MTNQPPPLEFSELDYSADLDDRVVCNGCPKSITEREQEFIAADKAVESLAARGDTIERKGKWVVLSWQQPKCTVGAPITMPPGMLHRCQHIKPANHPSKAIEAAKPIEPKEWWQ